MAGAMTKSGNKLYVMNGGGGVLRASSVADPFYVDRDYAKGDLVTNSGYLYSALVDMEAGEWDDTKWLRTNVAAQMPTRTSQLVNDSGFLTSVGEWEDITDEYVLNSNLIVNVNHVKVKKSKVLGLVSFNFTAELKNLSNSSSGDWVTLAERDNYDSLSFGSEYIVFQVGNSTRTMSLAIDASSIRYKNSPTTSDCWWTQSNGTSFMTYTST